VQHCSLAAPPAGKSKPRRWSNPGSTFNDGGIRTSGVVYVGEGDYITPIIMIFSLPNSL
jgi:hypothetical protein